LTETKLGTHGGPVHEALHVQLQVVQVLRGHDLGVAVQVLELFLLKVDGHGLLIGELLQLLLQDAVVVLAMNIEITIQIVTCSVMSLLCWRSNSTCRAFSAAESSAFWRFSY